MCTRTCTGTLRRGRSDWITALCHLQFGVQATTHNQGSTSQRLSGILLVLGLGSRMLEPCVSVVLGAPKRYNTLPYAAAALCKHVRSTSSPRGCLCELGSLFVGVLLTRVPRFGLCIRLLIRGNYHVGL